MAGITEAGYIKDRDCTRDTPVFYGRLERPVYGQGVPIRPRILGRTDTEHKRKIYLEQLFPLEDYDRIVVLLSGGWECRKRRSSSGTMISMGSTRQEGWTGGVPGIMSVPWQRRRA